MQVHNNECVIHQLKMVELEILEEFIGICESLGLSYFAVQGTLLGAIRHDGFIPWDDDIDVGMLRKDYEIFVKRAPDLLPDYYFLQTFHTDPEFYHCFGKLRDTRTTFIETTASKLNKMNQGIFIDIFPFDYYPENIFDAHFFELKKFILRYRLRSKFYIPQDDKLCPANIIRKSMMFIAKVLCPSEYTALERSEKLFKSISSSKLLVNNGSPWGKREIVHKSWMKDTEEHTFMNLSICIPKGYDAYLKHVYGEYMVLPPEAERRPHHFAKVIDPETPYQEWMKKLASEER